MSLIGRPVTDLDTPALVVDLDRMERNIQNMQAIADAAGVKLRPHVKTHKVPEIARMQLAAGAAGITVAKVAEAEVMAEHGLSDIFVAYPVVGEQKWQRAAQLARRITLCIGCDSAEALRGLSAAAAAAGATVRVRVEINSGLNRSGVDLQKARALCSLAVTLPGLELDGIFTFRGPRFAAAGNRSLAQLGREEGELMVGAATALRAEGIPIREVSVGSTPTGPYAAQVKGVTEIRPGTYVFHDNMQIKNGSATAEDVALNIWCTIVSRPAPDVATVDGGSKTFCGDVVPASMDLQGYGTDAGFTMFIKSMSEEHGVLQLSPGADPRIGEKLPFIPNHVCTSVNLSDELIGARNGRIEQVWPILARGKRT